ncbi:MAG TPA: hypothetical protein VFB45_10620 [Pseudolabrys sp.]|nr:hypothetical protein [Pseudolabrys sp.]
MSKETTAPADTLADDEVLAGANAPAAAKPTDVVTLADDDGMAVGKDGEDADERDDEEASDEAESGEGVKKPSGSARLKARLERLARENEELRRSLAPPAPAAFGDDRDLVPPREQDFRNDYFAYERALQDYRVRKAIRDEHRRLAAHQVAEHAAHQHRARLSAYNDRLDEVKDRIPDFDSVMRDSKGIAVRDDVLGLILGDMKGPLIAYHLAKNPGKVDTLNRMHPIEAAREIGNLSARIRGPQGKKATSAPPPPRRPSGGAAPRGKSYADMSMDEYVRARAADLKPR